jgi:hypothetical protein
MNHEIKELFYDMFPELFRWRFKPVEESLMSSGIDCDDKWFFLLWHHCIELEKTAIVEGRERGIDEWPEIIQIKEKCGSLRCYVRNESDYMQYLREKLLEESKGIE